MTWYFEETREHKLHRGTLIIMVKLGILIFDEQISETEGGLCRQIIALYKRGKDSHDVKRIYWTQITPRCINYHGQIRDSYLWRANIGE